MFVPNISLNAFLRENQMNEHEVKMTLIFNLWHQNCVLESKCMFVPFLKVFPQEFTRIIRTDCEPERECLRLQL